MRRQALARRRSGRGGGLSEKASLSRRWPLQGGGDGEEAALVRRIHLRGGDPGEEAASARRRPRRGCELVSAMFNVWLSKQPDCKYKRPFDFFPHTYLFTARFVLVQSNLPEKRSQ